MPFHNPYNFVPAQPRDNAPDGLADGPPPGHHRWHRGRWSGDIAVTMTVVTPLLLVRERSRDDSGHRHLEVATTPDHDGVERVDLAPTQVKGMLRSAFEAVTNSRFGVFDQDEPYGYRAGTDGAADLVPAIIDSAVDLTLLGSLRLDGVAASAAVVVPAWTGEQSRRWSHPGFAHGHEIDAVIEWDAEHRRFVAVSLHHVGAAPDPAGERYVVRGLLHATGPSIKNKRAERLFVTEVVVGKDRLQQDDPSPVNRTKARELIDGLDRLVRHQRDVHRDADSDGIRDREHRGRRYRPWEYFGHEPGRTAWSRHLYADDGCAPEWVGADVTIPPAPGSRVTCWAEPGGPRRLRPVMISRLRYATPPANLLHRTLHPASSVAELSPADRVFGWTWTRSTDREDRPPESATRGQLRVVDVQAPTAGDGIEQLDPLTISPLATPKPGQGRFYLEQRDRNGATKALPSGVSRGQFFSQGTQSLRGRKVYPHHQALEDLETAELRRRLDHSPVEGRPKQDSQNATLHSWVPAGTTFRFVLRLADLHPVELGALLWLLDPVRSANEPARARHRLGMGKPLGFGSVELAVDPTRTRLYLGERVAERLDAIDATVAADDWTGLAASFEKVAQAAHPDVLAGVRAALTGFLRGTPVRYPRNTPPAKGSYSWFVANEKGPKRPLPLLVDIEPLAEYREDEG